MKKRIRNNQINARPVTAAANTVKLWVEFYPYERYTQTSRKTATVSGRDLLHALKKMVDRMRLYIDSDDIEDYGWTAQQVIDNIQSSNGDGCDYIVILKDINTDEVYIEAFDEMETEDWDEDEDY